MSGEIVNGCSTIGVEREEVMEEKVTETVWEGEDILNDPYCSSLKCELSGFDPLIDDEEEFDEDDFDDDFDDDFEEELEDGLGLKDGFDAGDFDSDGKDFNDPALDEEDNEEEVLDEDG